MASIEKQDSDSTNVSLIEQLGDPKSPAVFEEAWRIFNEKYTPRILHWIVSHGLTRNDAEEVCQDLMVCLLKRLRTFQHDGRSFRGFLHTISKRAAYDFLNNRNKKREISLAEAALLEDPQRIENQICHYFDLELLEQCKTQVQRELQASEVGRRNWSIFCELQFGSATPAELSNRLGMPIANVYVAKHRVANAIREKFNLLNK